MQSFFIGAGACLASFMPWIFTNLLDIPNEAPEGEIADSVRYSFYVGGVMYFITVLWTVLATKEYPPEGEEHDDEAMSQAEVPVFGSKFLKVGLILTILGGAFSGFVYYKELEPQLHVMGGGLVFFGLMHLIALLLVKLNKLRMALVHIVKDFNSMPKTMVQLAVVQFFSWFALFSMWIYATSAITSHIYNTTDVSSKAYGDGANMVSNLFGGYNGFAALAAFIIPVIARKTNRKVTHMVSLFCGGLGLISIYFISNPQLLWLSMVGVGIAWASILSMPYAILSRAIPEEKMGYFMGVFNFFIVIPQILAASLLGFILTELLDGETVMILVVG